MDNAIVLAERRLAVELNPAVPTEKCRWKTQWQAEFEGEAVNSWREYSWTSLVYVPQKSHPKVDIVLLIVCPLLSPPVAHDPFAYHMEMKSQSRRLILQFD